MCGGGGSSPTNSERADTHANTIVTFFLLCDYFNVKYISSIALQQYTLHCPLQTGLTHLFHSFSAVNYSLQILDIVCENDSNPLTLLVDCVNT